MTDYNRILRILGGHSSLAEQLLHILDAELSLPNIPMKTMGGEVFWNTIAECNGWKLQQNMIFHNARILDSENVRRAWGTINGMDKAMSRMISWLDSNSSDAAEERQKAMEDLKHLKELFDCGALTEEEYLNKKEQFLEKI